MTEHVFIVDDDSDSRDSVASLVRVRGGDPLTYGSGEAFLDVVTRADRGCVVVDVRMSGMSGLELQSQLVERGVEMPVIVITGYGDVPMAVRAMKAGAVSFLKKPCDPTELWSTIEQALVRDRDQCAVRDERADLERRLASLTSEEAEVLDGVLEGLPNKQIAAALDMGLRTVELRRAAIMKKLGAQSLAELVRLVTLTQVRSPRSV